MLPPDAQSIVFICAYLHSYIGLELSAPNLSFPIISVIFNV